MLSILRGDLFAHEAGSSLHHFSSAVRRQAELITASCRCSASGLPAQKRPKKRTAEAEPPPHIFKVRAPDKSPRVITRETHLEDLPLNLLIEGKELKLGVGFGLFIDVQDVVLGCSRRDGKPFADILCGCPF